MMPVSRELAAPESTIFFRNSQGEAGQATLIRLNRNSLVIEVYNPYSIVQLSEVLHDLRIRRGGRDIYVGRAVVTNLVSTGLMLIVSASLVDAWSDVVHLAPGPELRQEVRLFVDDWSHANSRLLPTYQLAVSNVRNLLQELSRWIDHSEQLLGLGDAAGTEEGCLEFARDVDDMVRGKIDELFGIFNHEASQVPPDDLGLHKGYAQRELHPLLLCSPFIHRTFTKPLGYAGDYMMVNMILRNPYEGANTYARVVNHVPLRSATAEAHRNRIDRLLTMLEEETARVQQEGRQPRILNMGCGPAAEVQRFFAARSPRPPLLLELVDFNEETLQYAKGQIGPHIATMAPHTEVRFTHRSVNDLLKSAARQNEPQSASFDVVYCAGLFDYLSDRICGRLLRLFYQWTLPGGLVLVTNVHSSQPARGLMEHLQEWTLVLRNETNMLQLANDLGRQQVNTDDTGANVFLWIRRPAERGPRDGAQ